MMQLKSGSYYKTRDGRKVGPMVIQDDETFPFLDDTRCESYRPDGTWSFRTDEVHRNDLVAEWVDEPMVEHKFKVGDAVKHKKLGYVGTINDVLGGGRYRTYWPCQGWGGNDEGRDLEPAAVAPATAAFKVGDRVNYNDRVVSGVGIIHSPATEEGEWHVTVEEKDRDWAYFIDYTARKFYERDLILLPAPTPIAETLGIDLNPPQPPQVGDDVLIFGTIAAINHSPRGTNYNIVFETQNRRMSLHFLEEDFIVVDDEDGDCPCANDNGPVHRADTAKAFDAIGDWLRAVAVRRAA